MDSDEIKKQLKGPIAWMARNSVAANLLMIVFLVGGFIVALQMQQEVFPEVDLDIVRVTVPYPGASPEEIEQGIILAVEDEVRALDGVKRVTSTALEGQGIVNVELLLGEDANKSLQDVKNAVDSIQSFPEDSERPLVSLLTPRRQVISLVVYGDQEVRTLRDFAERIREELIVQEGITLVELSAVPDLEISIEVPQSELRKYNLTLEKIAEIVRDTAVEIPAGGVRTRSGEILLRTQERRDYASEFEDIPVVTSPQGTQVNLSDIAEIKETFEETDQEAYFDGKRAVKLDIYRVGEQKPLEVAEQVRQYLKTLKPSLPRGMDVAEWNDRSEIYRDRIDLLTRNARLGLVFVLLLLATFLEPRLAFWVTLGIPISIIGAFLFIPFSGASINMVSLFAFIITLGIIVDDAIVVGENIYQKREEGLNYLEAAIIGAKEISIPVFFAVLTNIVAFMPLFFVPGSTGKIFLQIPAIVTSVFFVSLIESLFILPSHLSKKHKRSRFMTLLRLPSRHFNRRLRRFIKHVYLVHLETALRHKFLTVASATAILIIAVGVVFSGYISFSYLPRVDSDLVTVQAILPFGVPIEKSQQIQRAIVDAANRALEKNGEEGISRGLYTQIGTAIAGGGPAVGSRVGTPGSHLVGVQLSLVPSEGREISGVEFANLWREELGQLPGLETINFDATISAGDGEAIDIELSHRNKEVLEEAAQDIAALLKQYRGVSDVDDGVSLGKVQFNLQIKPEARAFGLTAGELARQVRSSFYGAEALRQQRDRNEVKVMVRLPEEERELIYTVEELIVFTPSGGEIPLSEAAEITRGRAYTDIKRADGRRVISVTADVDENVGNANQIIADLKQNYLPAILDKYPGLSYSLQGQLRSQNESLEALGVGFALAMVAIYAMLAVPFKSYFQPFIVMLSIPFGVVGAIIGHLLLGYELSIISMFGIVALSGVVINDSLVFIVTCNRLRDDGYEVREALKLAGSKRFRPIVLTSLTTFFGLSPMIFETSMQARFLVPMAVSLGFGILFATVIVLMLVPAIYLILEEFKLLFSSRSISE